MSSRKELELFLYKNKYDTKTLIDFLPQLSSKTITYLLKDLGYQHTNANKDILETDNDNKLYIFSDGGCRSNGKKSSSGAYSVFFTDDNTSPFYKFNNTQLLSEDPTNNKAELSAILLIFEIIYNNIDLFKDKEIIIVSDSMYSINCIDKWSKNWIKNNWKNAKGENVKNQDIIKSILEKRSFIVNQNISISFHHIFSHLQEPSDTQSLQYFLWYGNKQVDDNINEFLDIHSNLDSY
jgi:ribonuclease HI